MSTRFPIVPNNIVVHIGKPDDAGKDITVSFVDYVANVASSEIYPTWPKEALIANIYVIISFALNRIYNEWYKSKGYSFDITSMPAYDQTYTVNGAIYENINNIVRDIFNNYIVKDKQVQPLFASYCDGRKTSCNGLSQWGSVSLANSGKNYLDILKYYYGNDISIVENAPVGDNIEGYPGREVGLGDGGNPVLAIQRDLKRIRTNYPAIPQINDRYGIYTYETKYAVEKFQEIFGLPITGVVDKSTWYKIKYIYTSVKKLSDLQSEGLSENEATFLYNDEVVYSDVGLGVDYLHYYLEAVAFLDNDIPILPLSNVYDNNSVVMVKAFQKKYGLPVTGIFGYIDWKKLKDVYSSLLLSLYDKYKDYIDELYPNVFLQRGSSGDDVFRLQKLLLKICNYDHSIPGVIVNGIFDEITEKSIYKIQDNYGFVKNGVVGPLVWEKILELSKR